MNVILSDHKYYYPFEEFQDEQIRRSAEKFYRRFTSQQMNNCWMTKRGYAAYSPDEYTYLYFKRYGDDTVIIENSVSRRRYDY